MRKATFFLSLLLSLSSAPLVAPSAYAIDVGGEAGRYITISFDACYQIGNNHPSRRVNVVMGPYSFNLQIGDSKTLYGFGPACVTGYAGDNSATFIDPPD